MAYPIALIDGGPGAYGLPDCPGCTAMKETRSAFVASAAREKTAAGR